MSSTPVYPHESLQPNLVGCGIVTFCLATIAVALRFVARRLQRFGFWLDDWLILAAWITSIAYLADMLYSIYHNGMGLHVDMLTEAQIYRGLRDLFILDTVYSFCLTFIKLSVLAFYWRIFKIPSIRLPIKIIACCVLGWLIGRIFAIMLRCIPLYAYWTPNVPGAHCGVDIRKFFLGTVTVHLTIDITLLILPIPYIHRLQITRAQKWGIYGIFATGGLFCAASVVQLVVCSGLNQKHVDANWEIAKIMLWAAVEIYMTMLSACLPSLRPIYLFVSRGFTTAGLNNSTHDSYGYSRYADNTNGRKNSSKTSKTAESEITVFSRNADDDAAFGPGMQLPHRCKVRKTSGSDDDTFKVDPELGDQQILVQDEYCVHVSQANKT